MRTYADSGASDISIISNFDSLSISQPASTHSASSSKSQLRVKDNGKGKAIGRALSTTSEEYEHVIYPVTTRDTGTPECVTGGRDDAPHLPSGEGLTIKSKPKSKSAARRARLREAARRRVSESSTTGTPSSSVHATSEGESVVVVSAKVPSKSRIDSSTLQNESGQVRKTRRGGVKARTRRDKAAVRDELLASLDSPPMTPARLAARDSVAEANRLEFAGQSNALQSPRIRVEREDDEYSEDGASRFLDDLLDDEKDSHDDEEDEDEVEGLSVLGSDHGEEFSFTPETRPPVLKEEEDSSVTNSEEAGSSIDEFLTDTSSFVSVKGNKLRLWQALCIELGLVELETEELPDLPGSTTSNQALSTDQGPSPSAIHPNDHTKSFSDTEDEDEDEARTETENSQPSRSSTPRSRRPPLPRTLTQARHILKSTGHVNLADYLDARSAARSGAEPEGAVSNHDYSSLVYPSARSMMKYTREQGRFVQLGKVKEAWLEPLLKDFGYKRGRDAA